MYFETLRDLLFYIFSNHSLVEDATKWNQKSDNTPARPPIFPEENPDFIPFWNTGETNAVLAIYEALSELSAESRKLKLNAFMQASSSNKPSGQLHAYLTVSPNDFTFWARKSIWTPSEAALISLGFRPSEKVIKAFDKIDMQGFATCYFMREYGERVELIVAANQSGQLGADGDPLDLIEWFGKMEYVLPDGLAKTVFRIQAKHLIEPLEREQQYSDREKETLLKLVAAMAVRGYRFNPASSRNPATKDIQNDLDHLGIGLDQKTILKWLREATKDLPDEMQS